MGSPKALMHIGKETFVQRIATALRSSGVHDVVLVLGADAERIRASLAPFDGTIIINNRWREGQLTSLWAGLDYAEPRGADGVLVCPVDRPLIGNGVVGRLLEAAHRTGSPIIVPTFEGMRGHPVYFSSSIFDPLRRASLEIGARDVVRQYSGSVHEVAVNDNGIIINIDTPELLQALPAWGTQP